MSPRVRWSACPWTKISAISIKFNCLDLEVGRFRALCTDLEVHLFYLTLSKLFMNDKIITMRNAYSSRLSKHPPTPVAKSIPARLCNRAPENARPAWCSRHGRPSRPAPAGSRPGEFATRPSRRWGKIAPQERASHGPRHDVQGNPSCHPTWRTGSPTSSASGPRPRTTGTKPTRSASPPRTGADTSTPARAPA